MRAGGVSPLSEGRAHFNGMKEASACKRSMVFFPEAPLRSTETAALPNYVGSLRLKYIVDLLGYRSTAAMAPECPSME